MFVFSFQSALYLPFKKCVSGHALPGNSVCNLPSYEKNLVRFLVCKVHSVHFWVGQTLPVTSHLTFKLPVYNTEVERVVTQRFRGYC